MRKSVVSILLVVALMVILLTPDPAQGWWRRRRRRRWRIRIRIPKVIKAYQTYKALTGKRGAPLTDSLSKSDLGKVVADVVAPCAKTADLKTVTETLAAMFDAFDANKNGTLTGAELDEFNDFLGTYNPCA